MSWIGDKLHAAGEKMGITHAGDQAEIAGDKAKIAGKQAEVAGIQAGHAAGELHTLNETLKPAHDVSVAFEAALHGKNPLGGLTGGGDLAGIIEGLATKGVKMIEEIAGGKGGGGGLPNLEEIMQLSSLKDVIKTMTHSDGASSMQHGGAKPVQVDGQALS